MAVNLMSLKPCTVKLLLQVFLFYQVFFVLYHPGIFLIRNCMVLKLYTHMPGCDNIQCLCYYTAKIIYDSQILGWKDACIWFLLYVINAQVIWEFSVCLGMITFHIIFLHCCCGFNLSYPWSLFSLQFQVTKFVHHTNVHVEFLSYILK